MEDKDWDRNESIHDHDKDRHGETDLSEVR